MANNFSNVTMRRSYDVAIKAYSTKHRDFFRPNGSRCLGSSFAEFFWKGFDGTVVGRGWDAASRQMVVYAYWRAGQDCAREGQ